jgi:competence protein ComEA
MKISESLREYFNFSKTQRRALVGIGFLIIICVIAPSVYKYFFVPQQQPANAQLVTTLNELKIYNDSNNSSYPNNYPKRNFNAYDNNEDFAKYKDSKTYNNYEEAEDYELFYFDPNTATTSEWQRLGIRDKTIETIQKYTSKGGHFYKPEDINKIFGLRDAEKERLLPFVRIAGNNTPPANASTPATQASNALPSKPVYTSRLIDINTTDTTALIRLPGIGSKLAQRILAFRDKLGGFYSINQVAEVYGLPDSSFQKIKPQLQLLTTPKTYNINTATIDELKQHPYFKWNLANALVQYRNQHGNYKAITDIKNIMIIDEATFTKISPYLSL